MDFNTVNAGPFTQRRSLGKALDNILYFFFRHGPLKHIRIPYIRHIITGRHQKLVRPYHFPEDFVVHYLFQFFGHDQNPPEACADLKKKFGSVAMNFLHQIMDRPHKHLFTLIQPLVSHQAFHTGDTRYNQPYTVLCPFHQVFPAALIEFKAGIPVDRCRPFHRRMDKPVFYGYSAYPDRCK